MIRFFLSLATVAILVCGSSAQTVPKTPILIDDLYRFDAPRDAVLSPDGQKLFYIRAWIDPSTRLERFSLWQSQTDGSNPRPMEPGEPDARTPLFSPDGQWIVFLSTRSHPEGWKPTPSAPPQSDPATDIWRVPTEGGKAIPLAGPDRPFGRVFNDGFYGRLSFSPDGKKLAFVADDGSDPRTEQEKTNGVRLLREDQGEGYTGYGAAQIWVADLTDPAISIPASRIVRVTSHDAWYGDPQWSPDSTMIAVHANRTQDRESVRYSINKNFDIWSINLKTKALRQLTDGPGPEVSPRFSPDGKSLVCLSVPRKGSHRDLFNLILVNFDTPLPVARTLFDHHGLDAAHSPHPAPAFPLPAAAWDGPSTLLYSADAGLETHTIRLDLSSCKGKRVSAMPSRPSNVPPGNLFLRERELGRAEVVHWKGDDGLALEGVLTLPPESVEKPPYKLIVYPHGGPHSRTTSGFDFVVQTFAAQGYAVFQPNFRGSAGYGQKFIDADRGDFGGGDMRDILTGADKLIADGIVNKDQQYVYGVSYGGFMTTWLVGQTNRFRAAVAQNAVTDLNMMWALSDIQSWTEWEFGGRPWEVPDKMRKHSPLTYVEKVQTPTLILHSRDDRRCPLPMGLAYYRALHSRGVPTGLVVYPDEGHGIKQPRHREDVLRRVLGWFAEYGKR